MQWVITQFFLEKSPFRFVSYDGLHVCKKWWKFLTAINANIFFLRIFVTNKRHNIEFAFEDLTIFRGFGAKADWEKKSLNKSKKCIRLQSQKIYF